ncbi:MAG: hypothetical protein LAO20_16680 [Acidobacteriia bacterium]|nr:hypothetical protein [Terriglobia bacterium]
MMAHLNLPAANVVAVGLDNSLSVGANSGAFFIFLAECQRFQRDTLIAVADAMETGARQLELTKATLTPDELRAEAAKLRQHAERIAPGGVADATGVPA